MPIHFVPKTRSLEQKSNNNNNNTGNNDENWAVWVRNIQTVVAPCNALRFLLHACHYSNMIPTYFHNEIPTFPRLSLTVLENTPEPSWMQQQWCWVILVSFTIFMNYTRIHKLLQFKNRKINTKNPK